MVRHIKNPALELLAVTAGKASDCAWQTIFATGTSAAMVSKDLLNFRIIIFPSRFLFPLVRREFWSV